MFSRVEKKVLSGKRLTANEALKLFETDDIFSLGRIAACAAGKKNRQNAYFIRNRHLNPTNICVNRCRFCAFSRSKGQAGSFELSIKEMLKKISGGMGANRRRRKTADGAQADAGISEIHIVGGLHPDWPFGYYLEIISQIRKHFPDIHIKAFTAVEVDYMSRISGLGLSKTLSALKAHGLGSMPGGGAEIFAKKIRTRLCPEKISGERWLEIMEAAHMSGIRTNATMLYGHIERYSDRVDHLLKLRDLQDRTGGFQAFIPLAYHPKNTQIRGKYTSALDDLKTIAVSRLVLDNFDHIKAYWIMLGEKISQLALKFGADDIDGTIIEEKITHSAGALTQERLTAEQLIHLIKKAGKIPVERDSFYKKIKIYR